MLSEKAPNRAADPEEMAGLDDEAYREAAWVDATEDDIGHQWDKVHRAHAELIERRERFDFARHRFHERFGGPPPQPVEMPPASMVRRWRKLRARRETYGWSQLLRARMQYMKARHMAYRPRHHSPRLAAWLAESRLRHAIPTTNLSAIRGGFTFDGPEDIAEAEARRLERINAL